MKNTFLIVVGSAKTILLTIEVKMTVKLTVKAYDLLLARVEKKQAKAI